MWKESGAELTLMLQMALYYRSQYSIICELVHLTKGRLSDWPNTKGFETATDPSFLGGNGLKTMNLGFVYLR